VFSLIKKTEDILHIINTNQTILYIYDIPNMEIETITRDKWGAFSIEVLEKDKKDNEKIITAPLEEIIKDNDFIITCEIIASTLKQNGFFTTKKNHILRNHFNQFLGSEIFLNSIQKPKYNEDSNIIKLIEEETPTFNKLLKNLFFNEKEEVILNFISWLRIVSFEDKNQDVIWNFFGTNEEEQGQGAGKGVLITLLSKMFSGLVSSVSNTTYQNNFNSNLMNKKIIVFDEVEYQYLKYETIKDITGNPIYRIEFKGKEPIESKNVSSWLMFSNKCDLKNKIQSDDRRTFLIRPNPKNGSLKRIINKYYDGNFKQFQETLFNEIENIIHIISISSNQVKTPLEMATQAHRDYFQQSKQVSILEINDLYKIMISEDFKNKIYEIFQEIINVEISYKNDIALIKKVIHNQFMNRRTFELLFSILKENNYIKHNQKLNPNWELFKENIAKYDYVFLKEVKLKETKKYTAYRDKTLLKHISKDTKSLNQILRDLFTTNKTVEIDLDLEDCPPF